MVGFEQKVTNTLVSLSKHFSKNDIKDAALVLNIHYNTIAKYFKGNVAKVAIAMKIINHFSGILAERKRDLKRAEALAA